MKKNAYPLLAAVALSALFPAACASRATAAERAVQATTPVNAAQAATGVIARAFGAEAAARFTFAPLPAAEQANDAFEYEAKGGRVTVRGSSVVAMTRGAYEYLKDHGLGEVSWSATRIDTAKAWPDCAVVRRASPVKFRYYFNVVTYGYSTPYWTWARWERELDWMALHGMNLPLALVGQEAIEERVWKKIGLTQTEIDANSCGPAHLPWARMGNIASHDGPLTPSWHADQVSLQHRILDRMKVLGISPITPAFAGFVPKSIRRIFPDAKLHTTAWGGFPGHKQATFLSPEHPAFARIAAIFNEEWTREFGKSRFRLSDSFNEMELPNDGRPKTELLAEYGEKIWRSVTGGDREVVWVMQGWMFGYQRHIWTPANLKALLSRVPDDSMLLLDLAADYNANFWHNGMNYDFHKGFYNKPWVFSVIPNMGGKTMFTGVWDFYATGFSKAHASSNRGRLVGGGIAGEGIESNELLHEIVADSYWRETAVDLDAWLPAYAKSRYGAAPEGVLRSWATLRKTCDAGLIDHPGFNWQVARRTGSIKIDRSFIEAANDFLAQGESLKNVAAYRVDAVEFAALALGMRADEWIRIAYAAHDAGDDALRDRAAARALKLLGTLDRLLESHPTLNLTTWLGFARAHPGSKAEQDARERNARRIVTLWGPPINDYSCRVWSGLVRDFYAPRVAGQFAALKAGTNFDRGAFEKKWVESVGISRMTPFADPVAAARSAVAEIVAEKLPTATAPKTETLGEWTPSGIGTDWKDIEYSLSSEQARKMTGVNFTYTSGRNALEIRKVTLVADGREVATDAHPGLAGTPSLKNTYRLKLPANATTNNSCFIRVTLRGKDGSDSRGTVKLETK